MSFNIYVKTLEGRSTMITVSANEKIMDGKRKFREITGSSVPDPQWKFGSQVLKNGQTFEYYGIEDGDNIVTNDRNQGGKNI